MLDNNIIFNKIDKLVIEFCDTSVQCDSLETLHDCMESILDDGYGVSFMIYIIHIVKLKLYISY